MTSRAVQSSWRYWVVAGLCSALVSFVLCSIIFFVINAAKIDGQRACYTLVAPQHIDHASGLDEARLCPGRAGALPAGFERTYAQVSVSTLGAYLDNKARAFGLLLVFLVAFAAFATRAARPALSSATQALAARVSPLQAVGLLGVAVLAYTKPGIIDMYPLGAVTEGLHNGVNFYYVSYLQGKIGALPIFPYGPMFLFFLGVIAEAQSILSAMGLGSSAYSLLQMVIGGFYLWLAVELFDALQQAPLAVAHRKLAFGLVLLNPLAIYYVFFLVQIDVISIAFIAVGLKRLCFSRPWSGLFLLYIGLVFAKPQHLLALVPIIIAVSSLGPRTAASRYLTGLCALLVLIALTFASYGLIDGYYESLAANPQAARVAWSTWWSMLSNAIVINRPVGMLCIACALLLFISPGNLGKGSVLYTYVLLAIGTIYAFFQSSFAHTFGLAIFLYPAIVIIALSRENLAQALLISLVSLGLVAGWGTGFVGDASNVVGLSFFSNPVLLGHSFAGIPYISLINSIEYSLHIAFGLIFMLKILMDGAGRQSDRI